MNPGCNASKLALMNHFPRCACFLWALLLSCAGKCLAETSLQAGDQPQWGQAWTRNLVSGETGLPDSFDPETGRNIKWVARLGGDTHASPIIASGRVYIGTNNNQPRDPKHQGDRGVLMCLDEESGELLWQLVVPKREEDPYFDWPRIGICSPPTIEGDRVYVVSNRGEVMCLDARGMANGNDGPFRDEGAHMIPDGAAPGTPPFEPGPLDADILWLFNLTTGAGIWSHDSPHSSILIHGPHLYLNTSTGVDNTHRRIRAPDAPSLVVLDKATGNYLARDGENISPYIFHNTHSSPSLAEVNGRTLVFFAGGNGVVYAFEPLAPSAQRTDEVVKLKKVWQFDFDPTAPKENVQSYNRNRREGPSNIYGMPVFHKNRIYVAGGGDVYWGKNEAWLKCVSATGTGDITGTGLIWTYPLDRHVTSTVAIYDGLVFVADCRRNLHCVDAETGRPYWTHQVRGDVWASPFVADGKVYLGTRAGQFSVLAASREKRIISGIELRRPTSSTVTAANGVLYVATMSHLYAVQAVKP